LVLIGVMFCLITNIMLIDNFVPGFDDAGYSWFLPGTSWVKYAPLPQYLPTECQNVCFIGDQGPVNTDWTARRRKQLCDKHWQTKVSGVVGVVTSARQYPGELS